MKKIYVSGPMTGIEDLNKPAFKEKELELKRYGYEVVNPADNEIDGATWNDYMQYDLAQIETVDTVVFLPGWQKSSGARIERRYAKKLGLRIL